MGDMNWQLILGVVGALGMWLGLVEKRLYDMNTHFEEKLRDKNAINEIVQRELKDDIARLETKIDMLLKINFSNGFKDSKNE